MSQPVNKTILPVNNTHGVTAPPAGHAHWAVVRANDGVEIERVADYATAVARAKVLAALALKLGLPT